MVVLNDALMTFGGCKKNTRCTNGVFLVQDTSQAAYAEEEEVIMLMLYIFQQAGCKDNCNNKGTCKDNICYCDQGNINANK